MRIPPDVVGIDVSKHTLDVFDAGLGRAEQVANAGEPVRELADRLAALGRFVVLEATGSYDRALRRALEAAGVAYARVNPSRARDFARAAGFLAKTDAVDARMLAALGRALQPASAATTSPSRERLSLLHKRRDQLVATRQQERTRLREAFDEEIAGDIRQHLSWLDQAIRTLEKRIAEALAADAELAAASRLLRSAPGIGPNVAATLLALVPELGSRSPKTIAALVGLAPLNRDSGLMRGQRAIRGGRKRVRDALYMAAVAASRSKSRFGDLYRRLLAAGKPPKLALIAVARHILVTANAMLRDQTAFAA